MTPPDPLTEDELRAIERRAESATPGPWHVQFLDDDHAANLVAVTSTPDTRPGARWPDFHAGDLIAATLVQFPNRYVDSDDGRWDENATFIAQARDDVPRLLAEIRRLRAQPSYGGSDMTEAGAGRDEWIYVVTDIEVDGPWPGANSMRSFASVAVTATGAERGTFEAVLEPLPGAAPSPDTYAWFQTQPEAWAAATTDPQPVDEVMARYVAWIRDLPAPRTFAASPIAFDGCWMDYYLRRFTRHGLVQGLYETDVLFQGSGLCLRSYAAAVTGRPISEVSPQNLPAEWLGDIEHTHRAIDDARGYAHLLGVLFQQARTR